MGNSMVDMAWTKPEWLQHSTSITKQEKCTISLSTAHSYGVSFLKRHSLPSDDYNLYQVDIKLDSTLPFSIHGTSITYFCDENI